LPYNLNHLTFSFSAIDWAAPHKLQYQYKLVGLDKNWSELSHEHKADYRNIPFGKFTFKVRAIGIAGKWSNTFEYAFVIHPPWWRAWWAYGLYIIAIVGSIWYYIKWREKLLKQRQKQLEQTVEIRTAEVVEEKKIVEEQKKVVEEKNHEILDSINYAKRIQTAILPQPRVVKEFLKSSFVLYIPKDIVAGDFYWMENIDQTVYIAACDCTGHGVPGALVSVVCNNALNRALNEYGKRLPSEIFDKTRELVIENFAKSDEEVKDGMDASLAALDVKNRTLLWSGANNPLWIIRKDSGTNEYVFEDIKADKQTIGKGYETKPFITHQIQLNEGDTIYLFTDGYADQFGGEKNKKMTKAKFRELILSLAHLPMEKQRTALLEFHDQYRGNEEQVDDICVIGVRV
jgi:serine phosphatase RsbU (regulator of sigma subunit)